jgi:hypothetical protein
MRSLRIGALIAAMSFVVSCSSMNSGDGASGSGSHPHPHPATSNPAIKKPPDLEVRLDTTLGSREVIDAASGSPVPLVNKPPAP